MSNMSNASAMLISLVWHSHLISLPLDFLVNIHTSNLRRHILFLGSPVEDPVPRFKIRKWKLVEVRKLQILEMTKKSIICK